MAKAAGNVIADALNSLSVVSVISVDEDGPTRIRVVHRVDKKQNLVWVGILDYVLSRRSGWDYHICRQYRLINGKMRYHWNFIIQWKTEDQKESVVKQVSTLLRNAAKQVPVITNQLTSYPLTGAGKDRNAPQGPMNPSASGYKQRGAHPIRG